MSWQYPLTNLEAVAELCKDPTRIVEDEGRVRIRIVNGYPQLSINEGATWSSFDAWPTASTRYRLLPLPEPEKLGPVTIDPQVKEHLSRWYRGDYCGATEHMEIWSNILGLAIAQAIRDARGEK